MQMLLKGKQSIATRVDLFTRKIEWKWEDIAKYYKKLSNWKIAESKNEIRSNWIQKKL